MSFARVGETVRAMPGWLLRSPLQRGNEANRFWLALGATLLLAFCLRMLMATVFPNIHRSDEIFQNLEPAFRMWSGHGVITWEWREGLRSPIFPGFLAGLIALSAACGLGAAGYLALLQATLSLLSVGVVAVGFLLGWRHFGLGGAIICGVLCAVWPDLVYFGPKTLTEVQAGHIMLIAGFAASSDGRTVGPTARRMFLTGLLLGLTFCVRFQLAPVLLLIACAAGRLDFRRRWPLLILGGLIPVVAMGLLDRYFWGSLFHSVWRNFNANIAQSIALEYGVKPVYWYGRQLMSEWGGAAVPLTIAFLAGLRRAPLLGAVAVATVLLHSLIGHKEISFVYAAVPPMIVVAGLGTSQLLQWLTQASRLGPGPAMVIAGSAFWLATAATTALGGGFAPRWTAHSALLRAEIAMRDDPDLCGLGMQWTKVLWYWSGGDVYLGRPIPIYLFGTQAGAARVAPAINYAIGDRSVADNLSGFSVQRCWRENDSDVCLARAKPGKTCVLDPNFSLNSVATLGRIGSDSGADR